MDGEADAPLPVAPPHAAPPPAATAAEAPSLVQRAMRVLRREPVLFVTLGYVCVSFIGLWASFWYYRAFGIPVLEYMQASDFLVAGLRDPNYLLALVLGVVAAAIATWPDRWRRRNQHRAAQLRTRWWGRLLFPDGRVQRALARLRMRSDTGIAFSIAWATIWFVMAVVMDKASDIRAGGGHAVNVTRAGQASPLAGDVRLLGTTSAFVFVYWPRERRAEALPMEAIAGIQMLQPRAATAARR